MRKITTYERFDRHIASWIAGEMDALLVTGPPGIGKSYAYEHALADTPHHLFRARRTPIRVFIELCDDPDSPVVFDDILSLLKDDNFLDMFKSLCETGGKYKTMRWGTTTPLLDGRPNSFRCTSRVLIVMNELPRNRPDVLAILDRCDAVRFEPTKPEIIARMRQAFPGDGNLVDLIARLPVLPSLRTLIKARQWQQSKHLHVMEELLSECGVSDEVHALTQIMMTHPEQEWCRRYLAATGVTERTYRRHKHLARQIVDCCPSQNPCPNVRRDDTREAPPTVPDIRTGVLGFASPGCDTKVLATQVANDNVNEWT